jgi:hypothetical protein
VGSYGASRDELCTVLELLVPGALARHVAGSGARTIVRCQGPILTIYGYSSRIS